MTKPSSLPERVAELEQQLPEVAVKADEASYLARKADEDVSEFSSKLDKQKTLIVALRETQVEQGKDIKQLRENFKALEGEVRVGFGTLHVGMTRITELLTEAEERSDES